MAFDSDYLQDQLARLACDSAVERFVVGFSGGLDSTVLLHALCGLPAARTRLAAVHVDHAIHPDSAAWERHCRDYAGSLQVDYQSVRVEVPQDSGVGLEAAARSRRYAAFAELLGPGEWLLSAHHEDDQAETLLLNLLRGSGVAGWAGIAEKRPLGAGFLVRPLRQVPRADLLAYAQAHSLHWLDDPSNADSRFDRNFLRNEIMPQLQQRWPAASARLSRSAALAGEASELLSNLAEADLRDVEDVARLPLTALRGLSDARQRNLLRQCVRRCGLPPPPEGRLRQILDELVTARHDAAPVVCWDEVEVHRHRDTVYLHTALPEVPAAISATLGDSTPTLSLGKLGSLYLSEASDAADATRHVVCDGALADGLRVVFRSGGESLVPCGHSSHRKLKKLLQERGVVPWMRNHIPLLYADDKLAAVANLWVADEFCGEPGRTVEWRDHPPLF